MPAIASRRTLLASALSAPLLTSGLSACATASASPKSLRLGYFANLTHGVAMAGMARGTFASHLGSVRVEPQIFDAGPSAVQALLAGALDVAYLGPGPAVTAWVRTQGKGVRLIAGAAQNGAGLVARPGINSVEDLRGHSVSTPQLGGTQDIALKTLLAAKGVRVGSGADEAELLWMANSQTLDQFKQGRLDASYQAEPWVSRLVVEAGAHVVCDEATRWPGGRFSTTCVLISQEYLNAYPENVRRFLAAHVESTQWIQADSPRASKLFNSEIKRLTGKKLKAQVMSRAMKNVDFSWDPMVGNIAAVAQNTWRVGALPDQPKLTGIADLRLLNDVLAAKNLGRVSDGGLGVGGNR